MRLNKAPEIMRYMGIKSRRAFRKQRKSGLPVYEDPTNSGRVFAFTEEIDAWEKARSPTISASVSSLKMGEHT